MRVLGLLAGKGKFKVETGPPLFFLKQTQPGPQNFESSTWETELWPSKSYVKALGPNVTVYGNRTFQEVIQVK